MTDTTDLTITDTSTADQDRVIGFGTSSSYGHGAVGGAAIAHGRTSPPAETVGQTGTGAAATDRQGRSITVRRRSTTTTPPSDTTTPPAELTPHEPSDVVVPPSQQEPGTSDTSTQGTRSDPDSREQGIGGGDTYDRNR